MKKVTESNSNHQNLEKMSTLELLTNINLEDQTVALAVSKIIPSIEKLVDAAFECINNGGRIFYMGAGTSGRLGILDASECPPTFGVSPDLVIGLIAGGDKAIRKAVEFAEDDREQGWKDLRAYQIDKNDVVIGIAASGTTPYVLGAIQKANKQGILTAGISCNPNSPLSELVQHSLVAEVGPEFVTGSTRMKSGTAQKLILNMISTSLMIKLGRVQGNKMVDMQLSNHKLVERGAKMIQNQINIDLDSAKNLLLKEGSVRKAIEAYRLKNE